MSKFTRKLILGERVMYADGTSPVNCVFAVSVRGEISQDRLSHALNTVQAKHPLLQARIDWKRGRPYFESGNVREIPVRVVERLTGEDWQEVTEEEWALPFDVVKGPLARVVWVGPGDRPDEAGVEMVSELVLVCPHCICDGATGVTLMREILLLLDRPEEMIGSYSVFRSVKEMIPRSSLADKGSRIKAYLRSLGLRILFSLRPVRKTGEEGKNYVIRWRLDEEMSGALIERCKSEDVTVHSAFCVALLGAYKEVKKEEAKNKVICPVDIRRYVREIRKDMMFAFAPIVELSINMEMVGFWERCRQLKEALAEKIDTIKAYELLLHSEYYHPVAKKLIRWLCSDAGGHDFTFSNMGRLDIPEEYGTFSVEAVYSPTVALPWRNPTTVVVSSFRRQMEFAYVSNSGFLPYSEAIAIKEKAMEVLVGVTQALVQADPPVVAVLPVDLK